MTKKISHLEVAHQILISLGLPRAQHNERSVAAEEFGSHFQLSRLAMRDEAQRLNMIAGVGKLHHNLPRQYQWQLDHY